MPTIRAAAYDTQYSGAVYEIADATIGTLLADIKCLKQQLAVTQTGMSIGLTRGWQWSFERDVR
ncbi:hypothetical protein [Pararhizobium sp. DWP3-4]|uniref:hypothetical protein n=1 Tax=Pararhizobium sp. DWP3-4 TaxID=2804565 RepID=UPI003CEE122E